MADEVKPESPPTGPEPTEGGPAGSGAGSNEAPDVDTPAWEGPVPEGDEGPRLVDPRPEIPGPAGI